MFKTIDKLLKQPGFGEQIVPGTSVEDLNPKLWNRYRTVISPKKDQEFLEKMKLISRDEDGTMRATVSSILMATDAPEDFLSSAFIQVVCYRGTERNASYQLDAMDVTDPLDVQIRDACKFIEKNMRVFATKAPNRIETPQFSMNVNAVGSQRSFIMDKRGEGVPIIIVESERLSGKKPVYRSLDDAELMLTIFAAQPLDWQY